MKLLLTHYLYNIICRICICRISGLGIPFIIRLCQIVVEFIKKHKKDHADLSVWSFFLTFALHIRN